MIDELQELFLQRDHVFQQSPLVLHTEIIHYYKLNKLLLKLKNFVHCNSQILLKKLMGTPGTAVSVIARVSNLVEQLKNHP